MTIQNYTESFKALSDANRLRILKMLELRTLCVCEIRAVLKLAPSTVSQHLKILKKNAFI
ncbi:MAG TPA: metalloregulator ArsR/SmtB family transcription factor, partial [bacterium]|nr:metalloregulator ArsR/SmtB family transcription factor [bacterium]